MTTDDGMPPPGGPSHDPVHPWAEQAAAYAVGALDAAERAVFEAHLATCADCRAEVRAYAEVAAGLAAAVAVDPPAGLRARIVAAARAADPRLAADARVPDAQVVDLAARRAARELTPRAPQRRASAPRASWLAAAAALLLAAGLGVQWGRERTGRQNAQRAVAAAQQTQGLRAREAAAALAGRDSLLAALLTPDLRSARLTPTHPAAGSAPDVRVYWARTNGVVVLAASAMPAAPRGRTYQLWGIRAGAAPQSLGTFDMPPAGPARVVLHVPTGAAMDVVAITEEPAGGSAAPGGAPIVAGALQGGAA